MIISIVAEKCLNPTSLHDKSPVDVRNRRILPQYNKG
jgi:hypothetical protein